MTGEFHGDLADRIARVTDCFAAMQKHWAQYNAACAAMEWGKLDTIRIELVETFEAVLDAQAAVYKRIGDGL